MWRYSLTSTGRLNAFQAPDQSYDTSGLTPADGNQTVRVLKISASKVVILYPEWLLVFTLPNSGGVTYVGGEKYHIAGLAALGSDMMVPKDAIYDAASGKVRLYYLDTANSRRLMRTGFDPNTYLLDKVETQVATTLGASGSTHVALRLPRGIVDERRFLVHLGNRSGTGTLSTVTVADAGLNQAPQAPALVAPGTFSAVLAKTFSWVFLDPNPDDKQSAYEVEIRDQSSLVVVYAPGKVVSSTSGFTLAPSTLSNMKTYEWRVRTYDGVDSVSPWAAWAVFSTTSAGTALITDPATDNPPGLASPRLTVTWSFTGTLAQQYFRVRVIRTDTGAQVFDTGYVNGPSVTSYPISALLTDVQQRIEVIIEDTSGNASNTATRLVTPSFSAPPVPTITAEATADGAAITVTVTNPQPGVGSDLPAAGRNDVYRADTGTDVWVKIGECGANSAFTDHAVAAGKVYDYRVAAIADGETLSAAATGLSAAFLGLYLHDPVDPAGTVRQFLYGGAVNSEEVSATGTELRFVGRTYPVFEYGEQLAQKVDVKITVPFGDTWAADVDYLREVARSRSVRCYRDSRGRKVFGVVSASGVSDQKHGSEVSLAVTRVQFTEGLPA